MFISDQCIVEVSQPYFFFLWEEMDRWFASTWPVKIHLDLCKALSNR